MGITRRNIRERNRPKRNASPLYRAHTLTRKQAEEFERRQAEPPREPTAAARELVLMFRSTVKR